MPTLNSLATMNEFLAKPTGVTLYDHTVHVEGEGHEWLVAHPAAVRKYKELFGVDLEERLLGVCRDHDLGKKLRPWQDACRADYKAFEAWLRSHSSGCWADFEKEQPEVAGRHLRAAGMRHEFYSPLLISGRRPTLLELVSIVAHHGRLSEEHSHRWAEDRQPVTLRNSGEATRIRKVRSAIVNEYDRLVDIFSEGKHGFEDIALECMKYSVLRGALQIADQRASAFEEAGETPQYQPFYYGWNPAWSYRPVQDAALKNWELPLLLLKATTGAGKTDAAFLWAQKQIEAHRADHLIIAMPTRFTANTISITATGQMSQSGLYHSSAWNYRYFQDVEHKRIARAKADAEHRYSRLLLAPTTVCTLDHLLIALTLTREDHHQILAQLTSACVVIDEADFYDPFVQANLLHLLRLLRCWKVPVLLMSASLPDSAVELYRKSGFVINEIVDGNTDVEYARERFYLQCFDEYETVNELAELVVRIHSGEAVIVYVNTVQKAIDLYNAVRWQVHVPVAVYHSAFTEADKIAKEASILALLGKDAWRSSQPEAIVILTQIGEMSINISASYMVSDLCPMDRLVQRVGRLQRFSTSAYGRLWLMKPMKEGRLYPAPYGQYNKKEKSWTATAPILQTIELLEGNEKDVFTNGRLDELNNQVYSALQDFDARTQRNADLLLDYLRDNILIRGNSEVVEDDSDTAQWSSRDIEPRKEVFIPAVFNELLPLSGHYVSSRRYQNWKAQYAVELRYRDLHRLLNHKGPSGESDPKLSKYTIKLRGKEETVFVLKEGIYSTNTGLDMNAQQDTSI